MGQILHAQELRGAEVIHVAADPDGTLNPERLEAALDDRVALVAVTHVCYRTGAMSDIKAVSQLAHKHGIPVIVDAYQSAGSIPIDFDDVGADFMVGGFLKYMLGLPGIGFLLTKRDYSSLPTQTGWFAARDVFAMEIDKYDPATDARRFEGGTPPIPSVFAAVAGLKLLLEISLEQSWRQTSAIHRMLRQELSKLDASFLTPEDSKAHAGLIAFKSVDEHKLVSALDNHQVVVSSRDGNVRISPHFYNTEGDVEALMKSLFEHQELLVHLDVR
ncbi:MAG: aminotransferase class V-fold PLP-dependent enzyme, partial [Actinomycetota bacterium]